MSLIRSGMHQLIPLHQTAQHPVADCTTLGLFAPLAFLRVAILLNIYNLACVISDLEKVFLDFNNKRH